MHSHAITLNSVKCNQSNIPPRQRRAWSLNCYFYRPMRVNLNPILQGRNSTATLPAWRDCTGLNSWQF